MLSITEFLRIIKDNRKQLLFVFGVSFLVGVFVALTLKEEYISHTKLLPESIEGSKSQLGGLSNLAGLAGINLDLNTSGALSPEIYPEVVNSNEFIHTLVQNKVLFNRSDSVKLSDYFIEIYSPSIWKSIWDWSKSIPSILKSIIGKSQTEYLVTQSNSLMLKKEDWKVIENVRDRISISTDPQNGVLIIKTEMPSPLLASQLNYQLVLLLKERITLYKTNKIRNNLQFLELNVSESFQDYEMKSKTLAKFIESNKNISNELLNIELNNLRNESQLSFEIYKNLLSQYKQAQIKLNEETPVFTVIEPTIVPVEKSAPKRTLIVMLFVVLGILLYMTGYLFIYSNNLQNK